jgi:hypothetical protein
MAWVAGSSLATTLMIDEMPVPAIAPEKERRRRDRERIS